MTAVVTWFDAIENDRLHQLDAGIEHVADFASVALLAIGQQQQSKLDGTVARRMQIAELHDPHGQFASCRTVGQSQIDQAASILLSVRRYGHRRHGRHRLGLAERTRQVRYVQDAFLKEKVTHLVPHIQWAGRHDTFPPIRAGAREKLCDGPTSKSAQLNRRLADYSQPAPLGKESSIVK
jgi:hypothetical protein